MGRNNKLLALAAVPFLIAAAAPRTSLAQVAGAKTEAVPGELLVTAPVSVPGGGGQDALWLHPTKDGLRGRACPGVCPATPAGIALDVPSEVLPELLRAKTAVLTLEGGRRVVRVDASVASEDGGVRTWTALVAAPLSSAKSVDPVVLWSGWVGAKSGLEGEESVNVVRVEKVGKVSRIVIGEQRASLTICGRPAIVAAREVEPATLTLSKTAMVDSLGDDEKSRAEKVVAVRETGEVPAPTVRFLRATAASSALEKRIDSLTDGSAELGWTEAKIGDGHGEWVRMAASSDVAIEGLSVQIRPTAKEIPDGAAPKTLYFATDDRLFQLDLPDSAWGDRDARYEVKLPAPVKTSCLAVVLGSAHAPKNLKNPRVTIAEVTARTALDGMTFDALASALAGGGDPARAAAAMLGKAESKGIAAINGAWPKLDRRGQILAMEVVDGASCTEQAPFYADRLAEALGAKRSTRDADPVVEHARDRLRRCGRASAPALGKLIREGADPIKVAAAEEMALLAPAETIEAILSVLESTPDPVRRDLRASLARAAGSAKARVALADWLSGERFGKLGEISQIDLLRAMGPVLPEIEGGKKALFGLLGKEAPFRTRYLLLAPAADLAAKGDAESVTVVRDALGKDADAHVRARAAEVASKVPVLLSDLVTAAGDPEVRVREAAIVALSASAQAGNKLPSAAEAVLTLRLSKDDWTFVRVAAADALAASPKSDVADKALAEALADLSPSVRGRALDGLGTHKARTYAGKVRERAATSEEVLDVRARALLALGAMCDRGSLDMLTKAALGAASLSSEVDRRLGAAAIAALGDIHPDDLAKRLEKLTGKDAPLLVREMARAALSATSTCD
ncbi:MAG: hypothetical protein R3B70_33575 [Polyangiaceae bacterium]